MRKLLKDLNTVKPQMLRIINDKSTSSTQPRTHTQIIILRSCRLEFHSLQVFQLYISNIVELLSSVTAQKKEEEWTCSLNLLQIRLLHEAAPLQKVPHQVVDNVRHYTSFSIVLFNSERFYYAGFIQIQI